MGKVSMTNTVLLLASLGLLNAFEWHSHHNLRKNLALDDITSHVVHATDAASTPAVSTTLKCVMNLTVQYFVVYAILLVVRTVYDYRGAKKNERPLEETALLATQTVVFCPMISVLIVGARMRALQLNKNGDPQDWAQVLFYMCTYSILAQTCLVFLLPLVQKVAKLNQQRKKEQQEGAAEQSAADGEPSAPAEQAHADATPEATPTPHDGDVDFSSGLQGPLAFVLVGVQYFLMLCMYAGVFGVIASIITIEAEEGPTVPVSTTMKCVMNLTFQYFLVWAGLYVAKLLGPKRLRVAKQETMMEKCFACATHTVAYCPMMCVLMIGSRMRALQLGLEMPQAWAIYCFHMSTWAIFVQTMMALFLRAITGDVEVDEHTGEVSAREQMSTAGMKPLSYTLTAIKYLTMFALYAGMIGIIVSFFTISAHTGPTPALSTTMQCVANLTIQFFVLYSGYHILATTATLGWVKQGSPLDKVKHATDISRATVAFAPMLCILFIAARMRALQIGGENANPPMWSQIAMQVSAYAVLLQTILIFAADLVGEELKTDEAGNVVEEKPDAETETLKGDSKPAEGDAATKKKNVMKWVLTGTRYVLMVANYGAFLTVVVSMTVMTEQSVLITS